MCANTEVNLVQQEIPVSKMPSSGLGSNPQGWPEVALANSGHKYETKRVETMAIFIIYAITISIPYII